jgi:murein DD-endopeptidase MepM/ murein hydrolase activator NlpD
MKNIKIITLSLLSLSACMQDNRAPVANKEGVFYGMDANYDRGGNELPKYNNYNRANLPPEQEAKYNNDSNHQYGVSAEVGAVQAVELPPPEPVATSDLPAVTPVTSAAPTVGSAFSNAVNNSGNNPTNPAPFDTNNIPVVKQTEEIAPNNGSLVPNFDEANANAVAQAKLNWQKTKDNAESQYDAKLLQEEANAVAEAEKAKLQQEAAKDLEQQVANAPVAPATNQIIAPTAVTPPPVVAPPVANQNVAALPQAPQPSNSSQSTPNLDNDKFLWPLKGKILKDYNTDVRKGLVIAGRMGDPVRAAASGVVVLVGAKIKSLGNMVIIQHLDGYVTTYSHLSDMLVSEGDNVVGGQMIARVGKTGEAEQPQLHFVVRHNTKVINPMQKLQ